MLGQEASHCARQNYIRPDPNEPDLPAWVTKQIQGPLTRKQQKVLLGHGFPGLFSNIFVCMCVCVWPRMCLYRTCFLVGPCMHVRACKALFCKWKGATSRPRQAIDWDSLPVYCSLKNCSWRSIRLERTGF